MDSIELIAPARFAIVLFDPVARKVVRDDGDDGSGYTEEDVWHGFRDTLGTDDEIAAKIRNARLKATQTVLADRSSPQSRWSMIWGRMLGRHIEPRSSVADILPRPVR